MSGLKYSLKRQLKSCASSAFFTPLQILLRARASVLCYHRITTNDYSQNSDTFQPNVYLSVRKDNFESQLDYISRKFRVCSCQEIVQNLYEKKKLPHSIAISFDDGYKDNLELALPLLEKYNIPATIFITTGFIDKSMPLWWEELGFIILNTNCLSFEWEKKQLFFDTFSHHNKQKTYLELNSLFKKLSALRQSELLSILRKFTDSKFSYDNLMLDNSDLLELSKHPLISIQAHTVNHPILRHELAQIALAEIKECKEILKNNYDITANMFAYPVGGPDEANIREFKLAAESGYQASFTTVMGHISHKDLKRCQQLPRIVVNYYDDLNSFKWKLSGFAAIANKRFELFAD